MPHWAREAVFYHLYPLGCFGAPSRNDRRSEPVPRLRQLRAWLDRIEALGANALYLGPVFEAETHGYDTIDYSAVDRRLGTEADLEAVLADARRRGIRVVLDGVFHHVGRGFPAFQDVASHGPSSRFRDWFHLDFGGRSAYGDPFSYRDWDGHQNLVKLDVSNPAVREHLFAAVARWIERYGIDGLRLDAADRLDRGFQRDLAERCRQIRSDFWCLGEVIHGDYRLWIREGGLDAVTNYVAHKGLWSSHNDGNYFEIAHTYDRQFGPEGIFRGLHLYNFVDNHDVDRIASRLRTRAHLYPLHILLFGSPGIPSIYYGSEYGIEGIKGAVDDAALRPALDPAQFPATGRSPDLARTIAKLAELRRDHGSLREGTFENIHVAHRQYAFMRRAVGERSIVAVNAAETVAEIGLASPAFANNRYVDVLNGNEVHTAVGGRLRIRLHPNWGCILIEEAG